MKYVCAIKVALLFCFVFVFYLLYCQHLQAIILVYPLKYQTTKLFLLPFPETRFNITTPPFRGCMKNVKNSKTASVVFDETVGVSKKCSDDWKVTKWYFKTFSRVHRFCFVIGCDIFLRSKIRFGYM